MTKSTNKPRTEDNRVAMALNTLDENNGLTLIIGWDRVVIIPTQKAGFEGLYTIRRYRANQVVGKAANDVTREGASAMIRGFIQLGYETIAEKEIAGDWARAKLEDQIRTALGHSAGREKAHEKLDGVVNKIIGKADPHLAFYLGCFWADFTSLYNSETADPEHTVVNLAAKIHHITEDNQPK